LNAESRATHPEVIRLKACINDLIGVVALPAIWMAGESSHIVGTLLGTVLRMLSLDFVYARVIEGIEDGVIEKLLTAEPGVLASQPGEIHQWLDQCLGDDVRRWPALVRATRGGREISLVPVRLGVHGQMGVVVAGSHRADFPTQTERLLLSVAANQAAIGLQEARLLSEQKRVSNELDRRVAQRTEELAIANEELRRENAERRRVEGALRALQQQLESHNAYLKEEVDSALSFGGLVGRSDALRRVLQQVEDVASTDATVLVTGESGTGKGLVAREIHGRGLRSQQPFVRVNCGAVPREMFESEFFGHVRGAFTGAVRDRPGRFQIANNGTIFLDEIAELPVDLQSKLLRVLQEGEYERVGDDVTRKVDVRVVAATNQNLAEAVRARRFREDLFYRLNVFPIHLPPLRARREDIPLLAAHAVAEVSKRLRIQASALTQADAARLQAYDWPGNVRELNNVIERAVILSKGGRLRLDIATADMPATGTSALDVAELILTDREFRGRERANLMKALQRAEGRIYGEGGAAELLGINPTTLASRLRAYGIRTAKRR
jgi:transcriptional regulator with GAF, ATPase, and Fis domain